LLDIFSKELSINSGQPKTTNNIVTKVAVTIKQLHELHINTTTLTVIFSIFFQNISETNNIENPFNFKEY